MSKKELKIVQIKVVAINIVAMLMIMFIALGCGAGNAKYVEPGIYTTWVIISGDKAFVNATATCEATVTYYSSRGMSIRGLKFDLDEGQNIINLASEGKHILK